MKSVLFVLSMLTTVPAFASRDCSPRFIGTGEAGQGYYEYPCARPVVRGCVEGEIGYFPTNQYSAEGGAYEEVRVCHNGTFFAARSRVRHRGCVEGETTSIPTSNYSGEGGPAEVTAVCHNGRFVRR